MNEQIYIDGQLMQLEGSKTSVQLIYQSPILTDFQSIVSNRTTQVQLPATDSNLKAIGYTGTQAVSDYAYRRHSVIYMRDGVQLLKGNAVLLSINKGSIVMCFTWGNVTALQSVFDTNLRDLGGEDELYCQYPPIAPPYDNSIDYGAGRRGVSVPVADILTRIESKCGVTGLSDLDTLGIYYKLHLGLTTRNGDTETTRIQGIFYGTIGARMWKVNDLFYLTTLISNGGHDPHGYMNEYGIIDVSNYNQIRIKLSGTFENLQYGTSYKQQVLKLCVDNGNGWDYDNGITLVTPTSAGSEGGVAIMRYTCDYDEILDVSSYERVCLAITFDVGNYAPSLRNVSMTNNYIVVNPNEGEDVIYGTGLNAYPVYYNLPDMSCGQFIKNLLWMRGEFAYSKDGKTLEIISFNAIAQRKAQAVDWTMKMNGKLTEYATKLDGTAQRNLFLYAEADWYDNTQYQGLLPTDDETIEQKVYYCKSDFAIAPANSVPVWTQESEGDYNFSGDNMPAFFITRIGVTAKKFNEIQRWQNLLTTYYQQYAKMIRKPVVVKANVVLTTYDLFTLDLTVPVYLQQTGHYYLIRTLTVKDGEQAEAELIKL